MKWRKSVIFYSNELQIPQGLSDVQQVYCPIISPLSVMNFYLIHKMNKRNCRKWSFYTHIISKCHTISSNNKSVGRYFWILKVPIFSQMLDIRGRELKAGRWTFWFEWPPRLPDLTHPDLCQCGNLKCNCKVQPVISLR